MLPPLPPPRRPALPRVALLLIGVTALLSVAARADASGPQPARAPRLVAVASSSAAPSASSPTASSASASTPSAASDIPRGRAAWSWPVPPPRVISRGYEPPASRYSPGHRGVDLAAAHGAVVTAPADGVVSFAGTVVDRPVLSLDLGGGVIASLEPVAARVHAGDVVTAGEPVGAVATGGHCDGACVHLGARIDGEYVNPLLFLGLAPRAVLLPLGR